jgi:hypothetical protein
MTLKAAGRDCERVDGVETTGFRKEGQDQDDEDA